MNPAGEFSRANPQAALYHLFDAAVPTTRAAHRESSTTRSDIDDPTLRKIIPAFIAS